MNIANVVRGDRGFTITFSDQSDTEFPFIWLRDNDPGDFHHGRVKHAERLDQDGFVGQADERNTDQDAKEDDRRHEGIGIGMEGIGRNE